VGALVDIIRTSASLEPQSRSAYLVCVRRFEAFAPDPRAWTPGTVERWRDKLLRDKLASKTVNKHLYALRYAARRREVLGQGPDFARAAESAKIHHKKTRSAMTIDDIEALLATTTGGNPRALRDRALITVAWRTGLRVSEIQQLSWPGIVGRKAIVKKKGGHEHVVILDDDCLAALDAWKKWLGPKRPARVFVGLSARVSGDAAGRPLSRQAIHGILAERGKEAGLKRPVYPHLFRHTFISMSLEAGVPPQRVMTQTGHRSLQTLSGYVTDLQAERDPVGGYLPRLGKR
jgi:integrase/recombinase XerD